MPAHLLLPLLFSLSFLFFPAAATRCDSGVLRFVVNSTEAAADLITSVKCSGGSFSILWTSRVTLSETIYVGESTTLNISGADPDTSVIDGGNDVSIFFLDGASLILTDVSVVNGVANGPGGAVYASFGSSVIIGGSTIISNNTASGNFGYGGAIYAESSNVTVRGEATISSNTANCSSSSSSSSSLSSSYFATTSVSATTSSPSSACGGGGAIYASGSDVIVGGNASLYGNTASDKGGAIYACASTVTVGGSPSVYSSTTPVIYGGVISATLGSTVSVEGSAIMSINTAEYGGAIYAESGSTVTVGGSASVSFNTAVSGGAIRSSDAIINVKDNATVWGNAATDRGAISTGGSSALIELSGDALLSNNSADGRGGAVYGEGTSTVVVSGSAVVCFNNAEFGGAITMVDHASLGLGDTCSVIGNRATNGGGVYFFGATLSASGGTFQDNTAATSGASIYIQSADDVTLYNLVISGGSAPSAGAIYFAGFIGGNATVSGSSFSENSALSGGALYLANKAAVVILDCNMTGNTADESGGAIYVSEGSYLFLEDAVITDNKCSLQGAGIGGSLGATLKVGGDVLWKSNSAGCCYTGYFSTLECSSCSCDDVSLGDDLSVCCATEEFWRPAGKYGKQTYTVGACESCDSDSMNCTAFTLGTSISNTPLSSGHWKASNNLSSIILECLLKSACEGGPWNTSSDAYCEDGYEGPYCAVCSNDFFHGFGYSCAECTGSSLAYVVTAICLLILALVVVMWLILTPSEWDDVSAGSSTVVPLSYKAATYLRAIPWSKLRIPVVVLQILTQYLALTGLRLPTAFERYLNVLSIVNINLGWILSGTCVVGYIGFYDRLLIETLTPLGVIAITGGLCLLVERLRSRKARNRSLPIHPAMEALPRRRFSSQDGQQQQLPAATCTTAREAPPAMGVRESGHGTKFSSGQGTNLSSTFLVFVFLIYSSVSSIVFQTFACDTSLEDELGHTYLRADYSVRCDTEKHRNFEIYAAFMLLVYPIGIPVIFAFALWKKRSEIQYHQGQDESDGKLATGFLWKDYKIRRYYWEIVECGRRLLLTGMLVFILPGTAEQAAIACFFSFLSIVLVMSGRPFADSLTQQLYVCGACIVFISMFLALCMKVNVSGESQQSQKTFGGLLIALNTALIVFSVGQLVMVSKVIKERVVNRELSFLGIDVALPAGASKAVDDADAVPSAGAPPI